MAAGELSQLTDRQLWIYPTALKARAAARRRLAGEGVRLGRGSTTFPELTEALGLDLGVSRRVLPPALAMAVVARVVRESGLPLSRQRGIVREVHETIEELQAAHLGPDEVAAIAARLGDSEGGIRAAEIARLYAAYEGRLHRVGALDRHGRERRVADRLADCVAQGRRPASLAGVERVVFAEIYDFSVLQFLIATSIVRLVGDAELVAFAHPENVDATRFLDRTWNRFVASEAIAAEVLPSFVIRGGRSGSLGVVLRGMFAAPEREPEPGDGSLRLLVAPHRYGEVETVLREVRDRLGSGGEASRIALVARDMAAYRDLVDDVAQRFAVPVRFRQGAPLLSAGVVRTILELWRCATEPLPRDRLAALAESDYFGAPAPGATDLLRRAGYVDDEVCPLETCLDGLSDAVRRRPAVTALRRFGAHVRRLGRRRRVHDHVRALRETLRALSFRPVRREEEHHRAARRDAHAWRVLTDLLAAVAGIERALGDEPIEAGEFLQMLIGLAEEERLAGGEEPLDGVAALSIMDARGLDFDVVYVLGLDDGTFPAARREGVLLPDWLKRTLNPVAAEVLHERLGSRAAGLALGGVLRTAREGSLEDPFLFFLAVSMAEREVVLSHPAADERGNPAVRSPFVEEVDRLLAGGLPVRVLGAGDPVPLMEDCGDVLELIGRAVHDRWRVPGGDRSGLMVALRAALPGGDLRLADVDRRARAEMRRVRYFLTPPTAAAAKEALADVYVGRLPVEATLAAQVEAMRWSPARLERLDACGFKFFVRDVLRVPERSEVGLDLDAGERGRFVHAVLEAFFREHQVLPADLEAARRLGRDFLARQRTMRGTGVVGEVKPKDPAFAALGWERVTGVLDELIVYEHGREPAPAPGERVERLLEWDFESTLPAETAGRDVAVRGRVDRVDLYRQGDRVTKVRVVDYKTSRKRDGYRALLTPREGDQPGFQIPIYLEGVRRAAGLPIDADTVLEGEYLRLMFEADEKSLSAVIPDAHLGAMAARAGTLVDRAARGLFDVAPAVCDPWCPYRSVCRYQPPPVEDDAGG